MKTKTILLILFVFATFMSFAQTKGNGKVVSEERNVDNFRALKVSSSADVYIRQGPQSVTVKTDENIQEFIKTEVEDGVLNIGTEGRGFRSVNTLEIYVTVPNLDKIISSGSGDVEFDGSYKANDLYISLNGSGDLEAEFDVTNLELKVVGSGDTDISGIMGMLKITVAGSGDVDAENLKLEECYIKNSGSGDLSLEGKANVLTVHQNGSGDLNASRFTAVSATVSNSGSADIMINVVENLSVTLNGSGDLTYSGDPGKVNVNSNGSGEVYKR